MKNKLLIVDDMALNVEILTNILSADYDVLTADSGGTAIQILDEHKPDLVLLDILLPDIDGFSVLEYMKGKQELKNIPVIFVTGEHFEDSEAKGLSLGAVDYVKKPYNPTIIQTKTRNHLELKNYRDNLENLVSERTKELEQSTKELEQRTKQLAAAHEAIIMGMSYMSESHDKVTGAHIERIKKLTAILCHKMMEIYPDMLTHETAGQIVMYSPLHDVGKVAIPDYILKKEGKLTNEEFLIMQSHTTKAIELLQKTELFYLDNHISHLNIAKEIAGSHHEQYDGSGYPAGLKGEEIPLSARIVSVADVFDALRSERPYKKAYTQHEAMKIILSGDDRTRPEHFDPKVLAAFKLAEVELNKLY